MESSLTSVTDIATLLIADTSTVINLNASGCAATIITALPHRLAVVDVVPGELKLGRARGRRDADLLDDLIESGHFDLVALDDAGMQNFEQLVVGPAALTLDDGEAATIAYAAVSSASAILDERKAMRICAERFPALRVGCTVDLFSHPAVLNALGNSALADAVFGALVNGRMRVPPRHVPWILRLIGADRAARCTRLPAGVRSQLPPAVIGG
jgi:predicted nucleic acid-binding protein